jgi:hypothetical protein
VRRATWIALLLAAFLLAGCDVLGSKSKGPPPKSLSYLQFVRRADHACARAIRRIPKFRPGLTFPVLDKKVGGLVSAQERLLVTLRRLIPPPSAAAAFQRLLTTFDAQDLAANRFRGAFEARQIRRITTLARQINVLSRRIDLRALRLGLRTCAKL